MNNKVDWFFEKDSKWQKEFQKLRSIVLDCGLSEELKWGCPCYTFKGKNIVLIHGFKEFCALLFHKGALLKDTHTILVQQTENVQSARQIRFADMKQINELEAVVKSYVFEAIEVEKAGLAVKMKETSQYQTPEELIQAFENDPGLKEAFYNLTPGRQRGYLLHFSQAKQSKTRTSRIEKAKPNIFDGIGYNEPLKAKN